MAVTYYKKLQQTGSTILYADPADISNTFKVKTELAPKFIGKAKVTNCRQTYTTVSTPVTTVGTESGRDTCNIITIISGSTQNKALLDAQLARHNANVAACIGLGSSGGFTPDSTTFQATV